MRARKCAIAAAFFSILCLMSLFAACKKKETVLIIVPDKDFYDPEYSVPREALLAAGYDLFVVTPSGKKSTGLEGLQVVPKGRLKGLSSSRFKAVVMVGGTGGLTLMGNAELHRVLREFAAEGKLIGAQCVTPPVLAEAGLLDGKRATCWPTSAGALRGYGVEFTGEIVHRDGNIITAQSGNAPNVRAFTDAFMSVLADPTVVLPAEREIAETAASDFILNAERTSFSVTVGGEKRTGAVFVPREYDGSEPWALVLAFHGMGGSGAEFARTGFNEKAGENHFILCYPDGIGKEWRFEKDVLFVKAAIDGLSKNLSIDSRRVYATGHSAGAIMTYYLAMDLPGVFAAIAPVAGLAMGSFPAEAAQPVSVMHVHALNDDIVPCAGMSSYGLMSLESSVGFWKKVNGAPAEGEVFIDSDGITATLWKGSKADTVTVLHADGKHTWLPRTVELVSAFFKGHPSR